METMETKARGDFLKIYNVKVANHEAGFHFFEADTMAFFDSQIESTLFGGCLFITSEQFHGSTEDGPRRYTVRVAMADGSVDTLGEFQEFETWDNAMDAIRDELGMDSDPDPATVGDGEGPETLQALLEAPQAPPAITDLWDWSQNFDAGKGPATAFLDLIGYSEEEFGHGLYDFTDSQLGYLELSKLGAALTEYAEDPSGTMWFVRRLLEAEAEE